MENRGKFYFETSPGNRIAVALLKHKGRWRLDLRHQYYHNKDAAWKPTEKGVIFHPEQIPELLSALEILEGYIEPELEAAG